MSQVVHLTELHNKYFSKGFRVVAITDEAPGLITAQVIEKRKGNYWIGSDPGRSTFKQCADGSVGIPHSYLIDAAGNVVAEGVPSDQQIEELLAKAFEPALGRDLSPALKPAQKSYEKGEVGVAWAAASKLLDNADSATAEDAKFLKERAEAWAAFLKEGADQAVQAKDYPTAYEQLKKLLEDFAGMEVTQWAAEKKKALDADESVKHEMSAWGLLEKARATEAKAEGKEKKLGPARAAYKSLVKKYPETAAGKQAADALKRLGAGSS